MITNMFLYIPIPSCECGAPFRVGDAEIKSFVCETCGARSSAQLNPDLMDYVHAGGLSWWPVVKVKGGEPVAVYLGGDL